MNKKVIAREWLIFIACCIGFFPLAFFLKLFGIVLWPIMFVAIPALYLLVLAVRATVWAIRQMRSRA